MSQMPEQEYECPLCHDKIKTRLLSAVCSRPGCHWRDMVPVVHPQPPKKEGGWIIYEPGPQADSPMLGCVMLPILLIAGGAFLFFFFHIVKEVL